MLLTAPKNLRKTAAIVLGLLLCALPVRAGVTVRGTQGVTMTGVDGIYYDNTSGVTMTGVDGLLLAANGIFPYSMNGVTMTGVDGLKFINGNGVTMTGVDGVSAAGVDGVSYTGANSYAASHADGVTMTGVDGVTMTGVDGVTMTGVDGRQWVANAVVIRQPSGVTMTGVDGLLMTGANGVTMTGVDGVTMTGVDGIKTSKVVSTHLDSASQIVATKTDGTLFSIPTNGVTMTGVDGVTMTGVDGVTMTGVDGFGLVAADGLPSKAADAASRTGLMSLDPELALALDRATDDSNINAVVVYHNAVTDADIADLQSIGVSGGTRYVSLPAVALSATKAQLVRITQLPSVRYLSTSRTLHWSADQSRTQTGLLRMRQDADLQHYRGLGTIEGNGVTVALLDTGVDSTHADLAGRVIKNVKLADAQGANLVGFNPPASVEGLTDTDQASGHGTFVGGIIAGSGASSGGKYIGYAPKARLVALSAGDATLLSVLAGFDYLLTHQDLGVRVLNCSFSANTIYDENDPVNVATRMLTERGVNVVFSAGNSGPGMHTLNPYAAAPWVISVGALDERGRLADFSSRGDFGSRNFRPTLTAPGVGVVSLRASGTNLTGTTSLTTDAQTLAPAETAYYTTASGTSFSAPQVVGTIALMLEANPNLTPAQVRDILQRTATPLPPYYQHEVGAGELNTHAAVLQSAFPARQIGLFRAVLNRGQVRFVKDPLQIFTGTVLPGGSCDVRLNVPADAVFASTNIAWGPFLSPNDLALTTYNPGGMKAAESNYLNVPGLTGKSERTLVDMPLQGSWRAHVAGTLGLGVTQQDFEGLFETAHVEYEPLADTEGLDAFTLDNIQQAIRALAMWPDAVGNFRPSAAVTRAELAEAMIAGARIPQYMPATPSFTDVSDATTLGGVESAQTLFPDAVRGGAFRPDDQVTRLVAAVVLVRAAGLRAEAESKAGAYLPYTDAASIPYNQRGYVQVAVSRGLMTSAQQFNPTGAFTRAELARGVAAIVQMNAQ